MFVYTIKIEKLIFQIRANSEKEATLIAAKKWKKLKDMKNV